MIRTPEQWPLAPSAATGGPPRPPPTGGLRGAIPAGLVWLTRADARASPRRRTSLTYVLNLKLADPAARPAFVDAHHHPTRPGRVTASWQEIREASAKLVRERAQSC